MTDMTWQLGRALGKGSCDHARSTHIALVRGLDARGRTGFRARDGDPPGRVVGEDTGHRRRVFRGGLEAVRVVHCGSGWCQRCRVWESRITSSIGEIRRGEGDRAASEFHTLGRARIRVEPGSICPRSQRMRNESRGPGSGRMGTADMHAPDNVGRTAGMWNTTSSRIAKDHGPDKRPRNPWTPR